LYGGTRIVITTPTTAQNSYRDEGENSQSDISFIPFIHRDLILSRSSFTIFV
jgi:hypothetical protein